MPQITTSDGVTLALTDTGPGRGPAVVLVAGFTAPASSWALQVDALVEAGYRTVCLDRRSHGLSEAPAYGHRMARHGKDLHDALTGHGLDDVVLVGGSMGASTIWAYLDLFGTRGVRGVVSVDQTPKMINDDGWPHGFYGLTDANSGVMFAEGVPATGRGAAVDPAVITRLVERAGPGSLPGRMRPETLPLLRDHAQQDWRDVVTRTDVPVLMVAARESQVWPCEHAAAAVAGNPLGRSVIMEDSGHAANMDRPEEFNAVLLEFLRGL
jgi:pimeloyl-ACP methyl ester carboxylesterase